jgi:hypothetical protein
MFHFMCDQSPVSIYSEQEGLQKEAFELLGNCYSVNSDLAVALAYPGRKKRLGKCWTALKNQSLGNMLVKLLSLRFSPL